MRRASLAAALWALAAVSAAAQPRAPVLPPPTSPPSPPQPAAFVTCDISAEGLTSNCESRATTDPAADQALAEGLAAHPLRLSGAPAGARLEIEVLRAELAKARPGASPWSGVPYEPPSKAFAGGAESVRQYYPERAMRMNIEGRSIARCKVTDDGRLNECWALSETPSEMGFGHAVVRASVQVRVPPPDAAAPPYDQRVFDFSIAWRLPREAPPVEVPK